MNDWHTSSYSANGSQCVEIAKGPVAAIRDTKHREQGHLEFPAREFVALIAAARGDEL
ncbi:DUF397 domain-containing protein [Spiractinospora alimapuensis]|uniref:DUF397 domain-containing protein n=1 Tax=Spiractinospora alimapuensis TaxID=2820884 RepID=UPI001F251718|nr:DUF397 domain-containing protein [Spiractinospora alimapuensis]QVQ52717.1 DUF397 domain-containing protein [Spiractinospora alimapuensis]